MVRVIRRWLLTALPVVLIVSMLTFVLTSLVPGDAARAMLGLQASDAQVQALRDQLGLDKPLPQQYWDWLVGVVHGDLGRSIQTRGLVASELAHRAEVTLSLLVLGVLIVAVVGISLGVVSAVRGGRTGKVVDALSLVGIAVPGFWLGLVLVALFAVQLPLFPATGYVSFTRSVPGWIASLALPLLTLALTGTAGLAKQTRSNVLDELGKDYVRMLRARGVPERRIMLVHVLRNAAGPVVTIIGLTFIGLVGGAVLLETVFVLPGVGMLMVQASKAHDIPVIQGVTLMVSLVVVVVNLLVEISYALLDPRVRA
jgi:peptide/nickel transport system permease protein